MLQKTEKLSDRFFLKREKKGDSVIYWTKKKKKVFRLLCACSAGLNKILSRQFFLSS